MSEMNSNGIFPHIVVQFTPDQIKLLKTPPVHSLKVPDEELHAIKKELAKIQM